MRSLLAVVATGWLVAMPVFAFPTAPNPAGLTVVPLIPLPTDHVVIMVYDSAENGIPQAVKATDILVTRIGNTIEISATLLYSADLSVRGPFSIDLGVLEPGRYTVHYSSPSTFYPDRHMAELSFSVSSEGIGTAIEYYNAQRDHYFMTAFSNEIAKLDSGEIAGWSRTGEAFHVLPADTMPSNANPVCRFYGLPSAGLDSHFFSDDPAECSVVTEKWPTQWIEETPAAFGTLDLNGGPDCVPVYRLYNSRPDVNHRYTVSAKMRDEMIAQGWILEGRYGSGLNTFAMCVPN